jgi:hypothetical protein
MADAPRSPYVGPRPFERSDEDRARFFGRDREVDEIVSLILSHPLVLVYAQSGAGKTSLLNTAVAEALERRHVELLPLARVRAAVPAAGGPTPANLYVATALEALAPERDRAELAGLTLAGFLGPSESPRTLVFDQFEELFTAEAVYELYGDAWQAQQEGFFVQVAEAIAADPLLRVVFVMRKEYIAELERFVHLVPERLQTRFHLEPLGREGALAAVEGPLAGTGRSFAPGVAGALVDRLLAMRVGGRREVIGRFVEPVQLQLVCRSLWERLPPDATTITASDVQAFGDVDTVLGRFYDEAVHAASPRGREGRLRSKIEQSFITSIGTRGTVYRTRDWERLAGALDELERRHVIHAEWRAGTRWYELTHDRLIDPIRESNQAYRRRLRRRYVAVAAIVVPVLVGGALALGLSSGAGHAIFGVCSTKPPPVSRGQAQNAALRAATSGLLQATLTRGASIAAAAPIDSARVVSVTICGTLTVSGVDGVPLSRFEVGNGVRAAAFSAERDAAVVGYDGGDVREWSLRGGHQLGKTVSLAAGTPAAIAFAPHGRLVAFGTGDEVAVYDLAARRFVLQRRFRGDVNAVAFTPDGRGVVAGLSTGLVGLAPLSGPIRYFVTGPRKVLSVAVSPDGRLVLAGGAGPTVWVWSLASMKLVSAVPIGLGATTAAGFSPDSTSVVTGGTDFSAYVWRLAPFLGYVLTRRDEIRLFQQKHGLPADGKVGPRLLAAVQQLGSVAVLGGSTGAIGSAAFVPQGNLVVTGSADGTTRVWGFFGGGPTVRDRIVDAALAGHAARSRIGYRSFRPMLGVSLGIRLPSVPQAEDTSSFATWCYWQAGAPDPNGNGYDGRGSSATLLRHMRHIPHEQVESGDLVVWGRSPGGLVGVVVQAGRDPLLAVLGSNRGVTLNRFSVFTKALAASPALRGVTWLTEPGLS